MCRWCDQPEDGGKDLAVPSADLGALGQLELSVSMWTYHTDKPFMLVDLWFEALKGVGGDSLASAKITLEYCPFCGKRLTGGINGAD